MNMSWIFIDVYTKWDHLAVFGPFKKTVDHVHNMTLFDMHLNTLKIQWNQAVLGQAWTSWSCLKAKIWLTK